MKPRKNYRTRPKKRGAKRRQRILSQKRRLIAVGHDKNVLDKMTVVDIRELLKKAGRKKIASPKKVRKAKPKAPRKTK
ncbi:MAG: hypothetical protein ABID83_04275, partial [Candidatus Omnitrophota bacterium]